MAEWPVNLSVDALMLQGSLCVVKGRVRPVRPRKNLCVSVPGNTFAFPSVGGSVVSHTPRPRGAGPRVAWVSSIHPPSHPRVARHRRPAAPPRPPREMAARNAKFVPIYEAIDEYNYRKAMTLLEKRDVSSTSLGKVRITAAPVRCALSRAAL